MARNSYTIYKVDPEKRDELIAELVSKDFEEKGTRRHQDWTSTFYIRLGDDKNPSWFELYRAWIGADDTIPPARSHSAVLLLERNGSSYAVTMGSAFMNVKGYCEPDFGMDLAERIVHSDRIKEKGARFFQSSRNKSVTSFRLNKDFIYDNGESIDSVKAETTDENIFGKTAKFGQSASFSLLQDPSYLPDLIDRLEKELDLEPTFTWPRARKVTSKEQKDALDHQVGSKLLA